MELQRPLRVVTTSVDGDVLTVLAGVERAFTAPGVQALLGDRSSDGVRKSLRRLSDQGIVRSTKVGQAWSYELNRGHLAPPHVIALAGLRDALFDRIRAEVEGWSPVAELVALFGSAARGTMAATSDVDLFVVRPDAVDVDLPDWSRQVHRLQDHVTSWTGNDARALEYSVTEVLDALGSGEERVLADIATDGIVLGGRAGLLRALEMTYR